MVLALRSAGARVVHPHQALVGFCGGPGDEDVVGGDGQDPLNSGGAGGRSRGDGGGLLAVSQRPPGAGVNLRDDGGAVDGDRGLGAGQGVHDGEGAVVEVAELVVAELDEPGGGGGCSD